MKKDLFGFETQGTKYEQFRPKYPLNFLTKSLNRIPIKNRYLDIATGTGQILFQIAHHFNKAKGIDLSQKMISVCEQKLKSMNETNISVQKIDIMNWQNNEKYNFITIGQALHWFPIQQSLQKITTMLENDGLLTVYGYVLKGVRNLDGEERGDYNEMYENFYDKKVKKYFDFDRNELHNHYSEAEKYPFEKYFKTNKYVEQISYKMKRQAFIGYLRTFSGYNTYVEQINEDPIQQVEKCLKQEEVLCVFDYFMIQCEKL